MWSDFTVGISSKKSTINETAMNVKTMERCFDERTDREMSNISDTVEDRCRSTSAKPADRRSPQQRTSHDHQLRSKALKTLKLHL